jgi:CheY-like chemotaxis protein
MVVDDNRDAADSLGALLRSLGCEVTVAYSGAEALARLGREQPEVVLLDIGMPELDGHEVARRIRRLEGFDRVTLIALTGWGQEQDMDRSRAAGFDHHLIKPADLGALETLLLEPAGAG